MNFGDAIELMKQGKAVRRAGWNGVGIFIKIQTPDEGSANTLPYIYIDTRQLKTNNPKAPKGRVPWLASQTDMLSEDWAVHIKVPAKVEIAQEIDINYLQAQETPQSGSADPEEETDDMVSMGGRSSV